MSTLFDFDELNTFKTYLDNAKALGEDPDEYAEFVQDTVTGLMIEAYQRGTDAAADMLGLSELGIQYDPNSLEAALGMKFGDKSYIDRLNEHIESDDVNGIMRVADTETHRMLNQGILDAGKSVGAKVKKWNTMRDDRVRDMHDYLDGMEVGISEDFYTYNGDHAPMPGMFGIPEEDVSCRCYITVHY